MAIFSKCTTLCFLLLAVNAIVFSQNTFVPDDNFEQALIDLGLDTLPLNDVVPTANITGVTSLTLDNRNIQNLTGIQDFSALTQLFIQDNQLQTIDVSNNINLQILWCFNNNLSSVDVSQNLNLISLRCDSNNITALTISNNTALNVLTCANNQLSTLNTTANPTLSTLICSNNTISNLNVLNNTALTQLICDGNGISNLNLTNNPNINVLNCANNNLTQLDTSLQPQLIELNCSNNQLCYLNVNNGNNANITSMNFSGNSNLNCVVVDTINNDKSFWQPANFNNYVTSINACNANVPVDILENFIGTSYTLPPITQGDYFTASQGNGTRLSPGALITTTQTIYIYNETACFSNESSFSVVISETPYFIPKYFTPNNDGTNDVWKIVDTNNLINTISIYNRHGKLLKFLSSTQQSWDGTFNGRFLPTDSYWYEIILNDRSVLRGYFALKR